MTDVAAALPSLLTPHVALRRAEVIVNPKSGGVGPGAAADAEAILKRFGLDAQIVETDANRVGADVEKAVSAGPDVVLVIAGDGTARTAASLAGPDGPLIAPLPGGTMNMLPKALYGTADWREALALALEHGTSRPVSGGEVDGRPFYVAAVLGAPALWAPAREAVREKKARLAFLYARRALRRAFSGPIRFKLDGVDYHRSEALTLLSPLVSKVMEEPVGLEAAVLDIDNALQAFQLAASAVIRDWRDDANVTTRPILHARAWARRPIPAILDGEPTTLGREVEIEFKPVAFRALAPARSEISTTGSA